MMRWWLVLSVAAGCVAKPPRPAWTKIAGADQPGELTGVRLTWDPDRGEVVLFGGDGPADLSDAMWSFDGTRWAPLCNPCNVRRERPGFVWDGSQLVIFGGGDDAGHYTNTVFDYSDTWTLRDTSGPQPAEQTFSQIVPYHGALWAVGGYASGPLSGVSSLAGKVWNTEANAGDSLASIGMGVTVDTDHDRILALVDAAGNSAEDGVRMYTASTGEWSVVCEPCTGRDRTGGSLVHVPDHDLTLLIGGRSLDNTYPRGTWVLEGDRFARYDDDDHMLPPRREVGVAYDPDRDVVVVYGGASDDCPFCGETWELAL